MLSIYFKVKDFSWIFDKSEYDTPVIKLDYYSVFQ